VHLIVSPLGARICRASDIRAVRLVTLFPLTLRSMRSHRLIFGFRRIASITASVCVRPSKSRLLIGFGDMDIEGELCPGAYIFAEDFKLDGGQVGCGSSTSDFASSILREADFLREEVGFDDVVHLFGGEACLIGEYFDYYSVIVGILCECPLGVLDLERYLGGLPYSPGEILTHSLRICPLETFGSYEGVEVHSFCASFALVASICFLRLSIASGELSLFVS